jgi:RNA polymerase sigma factor (sigma-70 family)
MNSDESIGSVTLLYLQLRQGNRDSARELWERYFPRMMRLAQSVLKARQLPLDAEDAVQEAFVKFVSRVETGRYTDELHRDDLWRILSLFTIQRARKQVIHENAQKRGGGRVRNETEMSQSSSGGFRLDATLSTVAAADCDVMFDELMQQLDNELREIAMLRLAGYSNEQIKELVGGSLRSVERRAQLIRSIWRDYIDLESA